MSECNCSKVENKERALDIILTLIKKFDISTFEIQVFKDDNCTEDVTEDKNGK